MTSPYSVAGFAYDDSGYHLLFESDADATGGVELAINTYLTLEDFFDGITASSQFSDLDVTSPYSVAGFLIEPEANGDPVAVDEPGAFVPFAFGLAVLGFAACFGRSFPPRMTVASR